MKKEIWETSTFRGQKHDEKPVKWTHQRDIGAAGGQSTVEERVTKHMVPADLEAAWPRLIK